MFIIFYHQTIWIVVNFPLFNFWVFFFNREIWLPMSCSSSTYVRFVGCTMGWFRGCKASFNFLIFFFCGKIEWLKSLLIQYLTVGIFTVLYLISLCLLRFLFWIIHLIPPPYPPPHPSSSCTPYICLSFPIIKLHSLVISSTRIDLLFLFFLFALFPLFRSSAIIPMNMVFIQMEDGLTDWIVEQEYNESE